MELVGRQPLKTGLSTYFRRLGDLARAGALARPLAIASLLGLTGLLLCTLESAFPALGWDMGFALAGSLGDPRLGPAILAGIAAAGVTTVLAVFACDLLSLRLKSTRFTPRVRVSFVRDSIAQWTLGVLAGTALYSLASLLALRRLPIPPSLTLTVSLAIVLSLCCVAMIFRFVQHISAAMGVHELVARIAHETELAIDAAMPAPRQLVPSNSGGERIEPSPSEVAVAATAEGYVISIDPRRLVRLSKVGRQKVRVLVRIGEFVPAGARLMMVSKWEKLTGGAKDEFRAAIEIGPERLLSEDPECGVLQIAAIALNALTPAVGDPGTAMRCIDRLCGILILYASREAPRGVYHDPPEVARVSVPSIDFERILDSAFEAIRAGSRDDSTVNIRLLRAISQIHASTRDAGFHQALTELGRRLVADCRRSMGEDRVKPLRRRLAAIERPRPLAEPNQS